MNTSYLINDTSYILHNTPDTRKLQHRTESGALEHEINQKRPSIINQWNQKHPNQRIKPLNHHHGLT